MKDNILDPNFIGQVRKGGRTNKLSIEENSAMKIAKEMERQRKMQESRLRKIGA